MGILKEQKKQVKKLSGYNYTNQFQDYLNYKGIKNKNGNFYSASHIRWYFCVDTNGRNPLDTHFLDFWDYMSRKNNTELSRIEHLSRKTTDILNQ